MAKKWTIYLEREYRTPVLVSLLLGSVMILIYISSLFSLQPVVPLYYSLAIPGDQLVSREWLIVIPIISFLISISHMVIVQAIKNMERIILLMFLWVSVAIQVLLTVSMLRILFLVT